MKALEAERRVRRLNELDGRRADLILTGIQDIPPQAMLSVVEDVRHALARMGVAHVSVRVLTAEDQDLDLPDGA
jgi:hypothetical protein